MIGRLLDWLRGKPEAEPIPDSLWEPVVAALPFLAALDGNEQARLRALAGTFLAEKEFAATGGLELSDEICVAIAAQGCLPILNLGLDCYRNWVGIIVYADEFVIPRSIEDESGVVHEYQEVASGEAWDGGPLLISWRDAQMAGEGYNVVIHEFAHKLDMLNGDADGIPPLPAGAPRKAWEDALHAAYEHFCASVDMAEATDQETLFDPYAAENPGEFFAVMSEAFFEEPDLLLAEYPDFYAQLSAFYRQDPARRIQLADG
ncbi:zinc-dependent peptidase [Accumulibacter sp.]|uniref:M90 family metallopeptidase n=1 Tax=Accumulibacter sp. TaxID=2053492 RepID=UPI0025D51B9D|nr:M90 family metallopeptidase [Accumulibacter sp.]MCM8594038.1 zinc-dependent peptidase [Accumulibacter sp.]MCM8627608.1 zinc-dependent peptidase [Accumulibacter sp.]MDS4048182.1 zinc-dependent peptidase [Accumulibacter sp.]